MAEYKSDSTDWVDIAAAVPALASAKHSLQCNRYQMRIVQGGAKPTSASDGVLIDRGDAVNAEATAIWAKGERGLQVGYIEVT